MSIWCDVGYRTVQFTKTEHANYLFLHFQPESFILYIVVRTNHSKNKTNFFDVLFGEAGRLQNNNIKIQHLH